jgi:hypothetical protein
MYQIQGWSSPYVKTTWVKYDGPKTTWVKYDGLLFGYYELHDPVQAACGFFCGWRSGRGMRSNHIRWIDWLTTLGKTFLVPH